MPLTLPRRLTAPQSYWQSSRAPRYSLVFALPLLVLYETLAALLSRAPEGGVRNGADVVLATALGALVFSAFHYIGPYGDPLEVRSFVFRFIGGLAFSALYLLRGFGITAWTHALYDA